MTQKQGVTMGIWTNIRGTIYCSPAGATPEEQEYILKTVLRHLPKVNPYKTRRDNMFETYINRINQPQGFKSWDEFGNDSNLTDYDDYCYKAFGCDYSFVITLYGMFRSDNQSDVLKRFEKWLCRFSKRVLVDYLSIDIWESCGESNNKISISKWEAYHDMYDFETNWIDKIRPAYSFNR